MVAKKSSGSIQGTSARSPLGIFSSNDKQSSPSEEREESNEVQESKLKVKAFFLIGGQTGKYCRPTVSKVAFVIDWSWTVMWRVPSSFIGNFFRAIFLSENTFLTFLTFLHHGIEDVERHLLWKFHKKKIQRKSWSNVPPKLIACIRFLYKVVHKNGRLRKFNRSREIEFNFLTLALSLWNLAHFCSSCLRPAGGVKHSDSDLVETRMLSAKKALRWIESSILSNSRKV